MSEDIDHGSEIEKQPSVLSKDPDSLKVGDKVKFDGLTYSKAFLIPKCWHKTIKAEVIELTACDKYLTVYLQLQIPHETYHKRPDGSLRVNRDYQLAITFTRWSEEELEYLNSMEE